MKNLKIATWNISCGIPAEWSISNGIKKEKDYKKFGLIDEVIEKIKEENIDVIDIQEAVAFRNGDKSFAQIIAENTDLKNYVEFQVSDCHLLENANIEEVILSKYPIVASKNVMFENVNLSNVSKDGKMYKLFDDGFIVSDIQISDSFVIKFITGHAPAFQVFGKIPEDYEYVYKKLEENIEKARQENSKMFIVGDYNTEKLLEMLPFISDNFKNYVQGKTYFEGTSIDYILAEKDVKCLSYKKIENKSDHLLCVAEFEV